MFERGIVTDGLGFQVFNAVNDEITNTSSTTEFLQKMCPNVPVTREMGEKEAPVTNRKMKELLGFEQKHRWQDDCLQK